MTVTMRQECSVCEQPHGSSDDGEKIDLALHGVAAYKVCPCCKQVVGDHEDPEYRKRAEEYSNG
jgi:hypothetical protein